MNYTRRFKAVMESLVTDENVLVTWSKRYASSFWIPLLSLNKLVICCGSGLSFSSAILQYQQANSNTKLRCSDTASGDINRATVKWQFTEQHLTEMTVSHSDS